MAKTTARYKRKDGHTQGEREENVLATESARSFGNERSVAAVDEPEEQATLLVRGDEDASAEALSLARRIVDLASDKMASDILLLDIRGVSSIADYFVIGTVGNERQAAAIVKDLDERLREEYGRKPLHTSGASQSGWLLLDFSDVIVHLFSASQRAFYNLEGLWSAATPVLRLQ